MSRFKTVAPVMIYVESKELASLKTYAKKTRTTMSQIAREGIRMRMSGNEDPYNNGFADGLNMAMELVKKTKGAQMMFPSGKSFAELVCEEIEKFRGGRHSNFTDNLEAKSEDLREQ
jgi:hypothetical protein